MSDETKVLSTPGELGLGVGDLVRVVVQDVGDEGDPIAFIDGTLTIIHEGDKSVSFADTVRAKVADISRNNIHVVAVEVE